MTSSVKIYIKNDCAFVQISSVDWNPSSHRQQRPLYRASKIHAQFRNINSATIFGLNAGRPSSWPQSSRAVHIFGTLPFLAATAVSKSAIWVNLMGMPVHKAHWNWPSIFIFLLWPPCFDIVAATTTQIQNYVPVTFTLCTVCPSASP